MVYILVFIFGAIIGSFLNVMILRYGTGESVVYCGSRCFSCGKKLSWSELIPLFSFLFQKGRCRECRSKISRQYPIVEAITGIIFTLIFWRFNFQLDFQAGFYQLFTLIFWMLIFSLLIIISVYDFRHQIIPNKVVYLLIFSAFARWLIIERTFADFFGGMSLFIFFGALWFVSKGRWMGFGDAKLALAGGWLLGLWKGVISVFFSFWLGALTGIILLLFSSKKLTLKSRIPFGPFLSLGILIAFLFGEEILKFYLSLTLI